MDERMAMKVRRAATALKAAGAKSVYVFGSIRGNRFTDDSDLDLAVEGLPPEMYFKAMGTAADLVERSVDLVDLDDDTPFTRYLRRSGELQRVA